MTDYTPTDIGSGYNTSTAINTQHTEIATAITSKLDADSGVLTGNLDADSNRILNLPDGAGNNEPVTVQQLTEAAVTIGTTTAALTTYATSTPTTVAAKLTETLSVKDYGAVVLCL